MLTSSMTPSYQSPEALGLPPRISGPPLEIEPTFPFLEDVDPSTVRVMPVEVFLQTIRASVPSL